VIDVDDIHLGDERVGATLKQAGAGETTFPSRLRARWGSSL